MWTVWYSKGKSINQPIFIHQRNYKQTTKKVKVDILYSASS